MGHIECKGGFRNKYIILNVKERETPFRKSWQTHVNEIKMCLKEIRFKFIV